MNQNEKNQLKKADGFDFSNIPHHKPMVVKMIRNQRPWQSFSITPSGCYIFFPRPRVRSWDMMNASWCGRRHVVLSAGEKHLRLGGKNNEANN